MKGSAHSCSKCEEFHVNIRKRGSALAPALVSPSLYPATPLPFVCFRLSLGILCILAMLCNASALRRQTSSSVFLLHCCTAGLPRVCVCVCSRSEYVFACACVRTCAYQSCSLLLPRQRRAHGSGSFAAQHCQSRAARGLFLLEAEQCTQTHTHSLTHTQSLPPCDSEMDGQSD